MAAIGLKSMFQLVDGESRSGMLFSERFPSRSLTTSLRAPLIQVLERLIGCRRTTRHIVKRKLKQK